MGHIKLTPLKNYSLHRKLAIGTWKKPTDPSIYGMLEIDMEPTYALLDDYSKQHGIKVTLNHLVGKALAHSMTSYPEANAMVRGNNIYLRDSVRIFYQVNSPGESKHRITKATVTGCVIDHMEKISTAQIAKTMAAKLPEIKAGTDPELSSALQRFKYIPWRFTRWYLNLGSWLTYDLNLNLSRFGLPEDPFGSAMITNVGDLGIDNCFAPLIAYSKVPLVLSIGRVHLKPWVVKNEIVPRRIVQMGVTLDHRVVDGIHIAHMLRTFKKCFRQPELYLFS